MAVACTLARACALQSGSCIDSAACRQNCCLLAFSLQSISLRCSSFVSERDGFILCVPGWRSARDVFVSVGAFVVLFVMLLRCACGRWCVCCFDHVVLCVEFVAAAYFCSVMPLCLPLPQRSPGSNVRISRSLRFRCYVACPFL